MVAQNNHSRQVSTLVGLLGEITEAYTVLVQLIEEKIEAMRRAETESIKQAVERERKLVFEIEQREGMRRQLTESIARSYGIGAAAARRLSAAQLAARIGGADADRIIAASGKLKKVTAQVARSNHMAQMVSQNVLRHLKHVFAAMTVTAEKETGYSRRGLNVGHANHGIFDAVG